LRQLHSWILRLELAHEFWKEGIRLLSAESLEQALQKASIHFVKPDGTPILIPASVAPHSHAPSRLKPMDENYQIIEFGGRQYELTSTQSTVIRVLHKAHIEKKGSAGIKEIQKAFRP
jgi:hypothetical protein